MGQKSKLFPIFSWQRALRDSGLPATTKAVGWVLSTWVNDKGENAHPGEDLLARRLAPMTTRTVRTHLAALRDAGFIERYIRGATAEHRDWADVYRLAMPTTGSLFPVVGESGWPRDSDHRKSETQPPENRSTDHRKRETPQHPIATPHDNKAAAPPGAGSRTSARADEDLLYGDPWTEDEDRLEVVEQALGGFLGAGEEPAIRAMLASEKPLPYIVNVIRSGSADPAA